MRKISEICYQVSNLCNLKCHYCDFNTGEIPSKDFYIKVTDHLERIAKTAGCKKNDIILEYSGGEAILTIDPNIVNEFNFFKLRILTNFFNVDRFMNRLNSSPRFKFNISIHLKEALENPFYMEKLKKNLLSHSDIISRIFFMVDCPLDFKRIIELTNILKELSKKEQIYISYIDKLFKTSTNYRKYSSVVETLINGKREQDSYCLDIGRCNKNDSNVALLINHNADILACPHHMMHQKFIDKTIGNLFDFNNLNNIISEIERSNLCPLFHINKGDLDFD